MEKCKICEKKTYQPCRIVLNFDNLVGINMTCICSLKCWIEFIKKEREEYLKAKKHFPSLDKEIEESEDLLLKNNFFLLFLFFFI